MTYYKWLTPEMTSHYDRQYKWYVGQVHTVREYDAPPMGPQGRGLYVLKHAVDALRFGQWPGRLFEAEPAGQLLHEDEAKVRCLGVRLIRETNAAQVFGPSGKRVVDFLTGLMGISWLEGQGSLDTVAEAAMEHQARLEHWKWRPVPVEVLMFHDWAEAAAIAGDAFSPAASTGAGTAWAAAGLPWAPWTTPWAGSAAWNIAWTSVEAIVANASWTMAKESWNRGVPWPAVNNDDWQNMVRELRAATRAVAAIAANHAADAAEYLVCLDSLPTDPFQPLMRVWNLGYWPMGVVDGRYIVADLSAISDVKRGLGAGRSGAESSSGPSENEISR